MVCPWGWLFVPRPRPTQTLPAPHRPLTLPAQSTAGTSTPTLPRAVFRQSGKIRLSQAAGCWGGRDLLPGDRRRGGETHHHLHPAATAAQRRAGPARTRTGHACHQQKNSGRTSMQSKTSRLRKLGGSPTAYRQALSTRGL